MRRHRNAKIVATLGPASSSPEIIRSLFEAGADVFRLNFSHGTHEDHEKRYDLIRAIEKEVGRPIGVLADLQGPKLRVGAFAAGRVILTTGAEVRARSGWRPGDKERVSLPHPEIFQALSPGVQLLLDDGKVRLEVESCSLGQSNDAGSRRRRVVRSQGVSVVGAVLPLSALTPKDRIDLAYGLELGADWIALSFVQRPEDVEEVRGIVAGRAGVMSKLEKPSAVEHLDAIVALSDAVMVARGDLGVEMAPEEVPPIQRQIVRACRHAGKPSIVATQMLESMIEVPTPTRAEASDVASAIYHGADAVMLSAESASGQVSAGSGDDDGPHHQGRGERSRLLPADERCGTSRARRHDSGRDLRQHAAGDRPAADRRRRHLHDVGIEQPARIARATGDLDPQHGRERWRRHDD